MADSPPGIYEALLTQLLAGNLPADARLYRLAGINPPDAAAVLAEHVARVLESVLRAPSLEHSLQSQVDLCNQLLLALGSGTGVDLAPTSVDSRGQQLLEIHRPPDTPLAPVARFPRPTVPLSQNALLVASKEEPALGVELRLELASADRVDLLCAFVRWSGIRILIDEVKRARIRGVPIRVITTTYTGTTELRALEELVEAGAEVRVSYDTSSTRLHAKAWLFARESGFSTAYIGSSNLSRTALHDGLEWNVRLTQASAAPLIERFRAVFETYWADPSFEPYQREVFTAATRRVAPTPDSALVPFELQPYPFQREMLYQLDVERKRHDRWRNLIVAATGTGKTVVSAFDYKRIREEAGDATLLFVAHRKEILTQSLTTFRNVLRDGAFGELMVDGARPEEGRHVFASIQSISALGREAVEAFRPEAYDVVIVDEFHHAEAPTYRRLLERLKPKVLLGLTATPDRADSSDIRGWFDGHVAVDMRLWDALDQGLLCPFQYFGVADGTDLSRLKWSRGGYEVGEIENLLTGDDIRVGKVLKALQDIVDDTRSMRALGFCVSVKHAEYMAEHFVQAGIPAAAVSGTSSQSDREEALRGLRSRRLNAIFAVDLFNEGLDIPEIDTVMFLRPTESPVVFLQQLGRGLRRTEGKAGLTVLDFIGQQHRQFRFEERFKALVGGTRRYVMDQIEAGFPYLPAGCSISLDRQSQDAVLANIKARTPRLRDELSERLRELGNVSLAEFLQSSEFTLEDIYTGSNPGWGAVRRSAGFRDGLDPDEPLLSRALARMLHVDDIERTEAYVSWLSSLELPNVSKLSAPQRRLAAMLHFDLWGPNQPMAIQASLERLWRNPNVVAELRELLQLLGDRAARITTDAMISEEVPLQLHARYSRNELLAALGEAQPERVPFWREGIKWIDAYKLDLFLVTLNKSERIFSPSTRYRDYPISPRRFHWESQSTTTASSRTGQRYIHHRDQGSRVFLCVRENNAGDSVGLGASPFLFLGSASYMEHEGERPMAIVWELHNEMPPDFFQAARVAA